jgi:hypothetical protein
MTTIPIGTTDGGAGLSELQLLLRLILASSASAVEFKLTNAKSPVVVTLLDAVNGANTITLPVDPSKCGGVMIVPPLYNTYLPTLKGVGGDTGIKIHKTCPTVLCFNDATADYPATFVLNWAGNPLPTDHTVVMAAASPGKVAKTAHLQNNGDRVRFTATTLPGGVVADTWYYIANKGANDFEITLESGGTSINFTSPGVAPLAYIANRFSFYWF